MRTLKASIYTLGCKVNSYESIAISEKLRENGIEICKPSEKVDICIINTCAVTSEAERKSRQIEDDLQPLHHNRRGFRLRLHADIA